MYSKYFRNRENVDFKKQYYIVIIVSFCLFIIVFMIAIKPTLELRNKFKVIEKQYVALQENPNEIASLRSKLQTYQSSQTDGNINQPISDEISKYCASNGLKVSYPTPTKIHNGNLIIETNVFIITGGFHKITKLAYYIEQEKKIGKIVSLQYEMKKNFETRSQYLQATLYLQTIKNINDEQ